MASTPTVSLREITPANRAAVEALTVTAVQAEYVAGVAESLIEAAETPDAMPCTAPCTQTTGPSASS